MSLFLFDLLVPLIIIMDSGLRFLWDSCVCANVCVSESLCISCTFSLTFSSCSIVLSYYELFGFYLYYIIIYMLGCFLMGDKKDIDKDGS